MQCDIVYDIAYYIITAITVIAGGLPANWLEHASSN
jgi:hypothetical protein